MFGIYNMYPKAPSAHRYTCIIHTRHVYITYDTVYVYHLSMMTTFTSNQFSAKLTITVLRCCWLGGRKSIQPVKIWSDEVLAWLSVWSEMQMICIWSSWCHCHPITVASAKSRMVYPSGTGLPSCCEKRPLYGCVCVTITNYFYFTAVQTDSTLQPIYTFKVPSFTHQKHRKHSQNWTHGWYHSAYVLRWLVHQQ